MEEYAFDPDHAFRRERPGGLLRFAQKTYKYNRPPALYHSMPLNFLKLSMLILMLSNSSWEVWSCSRMI